MRKANWRPQEATFGESSSPHFTSPTWKSKKTHTHTLTHTRRGGGGEGQHLSAFPKRFCIRNALIYEQEKKRKKNLKGKAKREKVVLLKNSHSKAEECMLQGEGEERGEVAELNRLIGAERLSQSQAKTKKPKSKCPKNKEKKKQVRNQRSNQTESKQKRATTNNRATTTTIADLSSWGRKGEQAKGKKEKGKGLRGVAIFAYFYLIFWPFSQAKHTDTKQPRHTHTHS